MKGLSIRMATRDDARSIGDNLRHADLEEMRAVLGDVQDTSESLIYGVDNSAYPMVAVYDDVPMGLFGVIRDPIHEDVGCIWMMGTPELVRHKRLFIANSKQCLQTLSGSFRLLWCCMDKRNTVHARWIRWMGFSFLREIPSFGEQRRPFLEFAKINDNV